ncbi:MAG TPA: FG-GAP-like repeat-containing protein, partial [Candidatus Acidoferrales bacterium]|nr:FG-GAP-like repeat-containing protein [Candidatus Acidoferrales bacterium]
MKKTASRLGIFAICLSLAVVLWWLPSAAAPQSTPPEKPVSIIVTASEVEARRVLERLHRGEDFAALARDQSIDPSAHDGGYLGNLDPANLRSELREAVNGVAAGQVSDIVKIPSGYAVLKVLTQPPPQGLNAKGPNDAAPTQAAPTKMQAVAGAGAVRLTYDYAGFAAALLAVNKFDKPAGWDRDLHQACEVRVQSVTGVLQQLQLLMARPNPPASFTRDVNALRADLHAYRGDMNDAILYWHAAYDVALANFPDKAPQLEESLGVAYLQKAGSVLYKDFVFPRPLAASAVHELQREDLKQAAEYFLRYLKREPADGEVRWLLNLTYMLSGQYPGGVPKEFLIAPAVWESKEDVVHFVDVAAAAGVNRHGQAGGAIIDDFDNDGVLDIVVSSVNDCEPIAYYHGNGDGTFTNLAAQAGLANVTGGLNIIQTDYNNDGCKDILVLRGGWEYPRPKSLLRNNCDGTFTDVTHGSGLEEPLTATQTAVWADIDNDGKLDLFVGNENAASQLFLNRGDGTFVDIAGAAGVSQPGFTKGVIAADYDNDGYVDLYASTLNGEHHLYHNNHDRTFTDVTVAAGVQGPWASFGAWFFDYDNDGWPDLFVADYGASVEDVMRGFRKQPQSGEKLRLFKNLGNGRFRDVTAETGLDRAMMPMGLNFGDIDNDGFLDFYLGSGNPSYASPIPNVLFHNQGGKRFVDITASSGTGVLPKGHGVAFADLDRDGDEDLFVVMGGAAQGDQQTARLFENPGNGNDWINIRLLGVKSNRAAIGARVKVTVRNEGGAPRSIYRTVASGGSFGASPLEQHIGLGKSARIENLEIWWPASNTRQNFSGVARNQFIEIQEFGERYQTLER